MNVCSSVTMENWIFFHRTFFLEMSSEICYLSLHTTSCNTMYIRLRHNLFKMVYNNGCSQNMYQNYCFYVKKAIDPFLPHCPHLLNTDVGKTTVLSTVQSLPKVLNFKCLLQRFRKYLANFLLGNPFRGLKLGSKWIKDKIV